MTDSKRSSEETPSEPQKPLDTKPAESRPSPTLRTLEAANVRARIACNTRF